MSQHPVVPDWLYVWQCRICGGWWWTDLISRLLADGRRVSFCPFCGAPVSTERQEATAAKGGQS